MNKEDNLIPKTPFNQRPNFKELSAKGGRAKTKAKTQSAQLRELRKGNGNATETVKKLLTDPEADIIDILTILKAWEPHIKGIRDATMYITARLNTHKAAHGEKKTVEIKGNLNLAQEIKTFLKEDGEWEKKNSSTNSNTNPTLPSESSTSQKPDSESCPVGDGSENQ